MSTKPKMQLKHLVLILPHLPRLRHHRHHLHHHLRRHRHRHPLLRHRCPHLHPIRSLRRRQCCPRNRSDKTIGLRACSKSVCNRGRSRCSIPSVAYRGRVVDHHGRGHHSMVARWQNLIPSFPWIPPGWRAWGRNPRKGRDQILQHSVAEPSSRSPEEKHI